MTTQVLCVNATKPQATSSYKFPKPTAKSLSSSSGKSAQASQTLKLKLGKKIKK